MFRIIPEGESYREYALLKDGQSILLRAATPADVPAVEAFMGTVSRESLQMRFMGGVAMVSRRFVEELCINDPKDRFCLLAIVGEAPAHRVVGLGNYVSLGGRGRAEVAFMVADDHQDRGIGTLILERVAGIAAGNGYVGFEAEVLADNQKMLGVFERSGFVAKQAFEGGCIHVEFPVGGAAVLRERAEIRDRIAAANSLLPLLRPKVLAVVGASRDPSSMGSMIFRHILNANYRGTAYPVNNQAASVNGVRAYPSLDSLPERPDLVVVAVPASSSLQVVQDGIAAGAKGFLIISSGFAEAGPEGFALQEDLLTQVRSHGARLVGPNCLGLMNTQPEIRLNASLAPSLPPEGRIGFFSHSAALGLVIMNYAVERGLGFSTFVSAGNRADVSGNDLLQYWEEDPNTDIALLYLETFGNPRRFARIARRVAWRKPVLCVKSARSRAGRDAARAHIAAAALGEEEVSMLFRQAGLIRAATLEVMFDVAVLLSSQPLPAGNRVAIISNSGGVVTICADACEANGLEVITPGGMDLGPMATPKSYESAIQAALERSDTDALIAIFACVGDCDPEPVGAAIRQGVAAAERATGTSKPVLLCLMGARGAVRLSAPEAAGASSRTTFPSYRFPESAALALGRVAQYAEFRRRPAGRLLWYEDADADSARVSLEPVLAGAAPGATVWADDEKVQSILRAFGIPLALSPEETEPVDEAPLRLSVRSDPSFGPVIGLSGEGGRRVERITPLLDDDAAEMARALGLANSNGEEELLGRVSQLVEELPWLVELQADLGPPVMAGGPARLAGGVRMAFKRI